MIAVGNSRFQLKCYDELFVKRKHCAMILVSHQYDILKQFCDKALVIKSGRSCVFEDIEFAYKLYASL